VPSATPRSCRRCLSTTASPRSLRVRLLPAPCGVSVCKWCTKCLSPCVPFLGGACVVAHGIGTLVLSCAVVSLKLVTETETEGHPSRLEGEKAPACMSSHSFGPSSRTCDTPAPRAERHRAKKTQTPIHSLETS
jgi:hypothetical protein